MRKSILILCIGSLLFYGCGSTRKTTQAPSASSPSTSSGSRAPLLDSNTFELTELSDDETYGYTEKNHVKVGGVKQMEGPLNERRFLNALAGPNGETVTYHRVGSCCPFETPNGFMDRGLLDKYEVKYDGLEKPVYIFINMYDFGTLKAPKGFTIKK